MGFLFWIMALVGCGVAVYLWTKKKTVPAICCTLVGAVGIFFIVCSFLLRWGID